MALSATSNGDFPHNVVGSMLLVGRLSCLPNPLRQLSRSRQRTRLATIRTSPWTQPATSIMNFRNTRWMTGGHHVLEKVATQIRSATPRCKVNLKRGSNKATATTCHSVEPLRQRPPTPRRRSGIPSSTTSHGRSVVKPT